MKRILILGLLVLIFLLSIYFSQHQSGIKTKNISINGHKFIVEVADTESLRSQGLSGKPSLSSDSGMLFIFPSASYYRFWMKEMRFPLDFIWINNERIVDLTQNVLPPKTDNIGELQTFSSHSPFDQVIEVKAGVIASLSIKIGDAVKYSN